MAKYAVIETGGKQYRVGIGDSIEVELIDREPKEDVVIDKVLLVVDGKDVHVGKPYLENAKVFCEVNTHFRGPKKVAFKYRRRKSSRSKIGHRQELTRLVVKDIEP